MNGIVFAYCPYEVIIIVVKFINIGNAFVRAAFDVGAKLVHDEFFSASVFKNDGKAFFAVKNFKSIGAGAFIIILISNLS